MDFKKKVFDAVKKIPKGFNNIMNVLTKTLFMKRLNWLGVFLLGAVAIGIPFLVSAAPTLSVTQNATSLKVTGDKFKIYLERQYGWHVSKYFHINDTAETDNLIGTASYDERWPHIGDNAVGSSFDNQASLTVLENTPTRLKLQVNGVYDSIFYAGNRDPNLTFTTYFTIYPDGTVVGVRTNTNNGTTTKTTMLRYFEVQSAGTVTKSTNTLDPFVGGIYPRDGMYLINRTGSFGHALLFGLYESPIPKDFVNYGYVLLPNFSGLTAATSETYRFIGNFSDSLTGINSGNSAKPIWDDYRNPDTLTFINGAVSGTGYDIGEKAYMISASLNRATFTINGSTYRRINPIFKVTNFTAAIPTTITVDGVTKNKDVDYNATQLDTSTIIVQYFGTFTTSAAFDINGSSGGGTSPLRSSGLPSGTLAATTTSVTLSLSTNVNATCKYGIIAGTNYASMPSTFTTTGSTSHSSILSGLSAGTYTYYVRCQDSTLNTNTDDFPISFIIPSPSSSPVISAVTTSNLTSSSVTITWFTDRAADSQVEYGLTAAYGNLTTLDTTLVTTHSQTLSGLQASILYNYRVRSSDGLGNLASTTNATFTTSPTVIGTCSTQLGYTAICSKPSLPTIPPVAGGSYIDPAFGTTIYRITDPTVATDWASTNSSSMSGMWNSDGTMFYLHLNQGTALYSINRITNTTTYLGLMPTTGSPDYYTLSWDGSTWDPTDPNTIYAIVMSTLKRQLWKYTVTSKSPLTISKTMLHDFSVEIPTGGYPYSFIGVSSNSRYFGITASSYGVQDQFDYVVFWDSQTGTSKIMNTLSRLGVTGLHGMVTDNSGTYATIEPGDFSGSWIWNWSIDNLSNKLIGDIPDCFGGHKAPGNGVVMSPGCLGGEWVQRSYATPQTFSTIFTWPFKNGKIDYFEDSHSSRVYGNGAFFVMSRYISDFSWKTSFILHSGAIYKFVGYKAFSGNFDTPESVRYKGLYLPQVSGIPTAANQWYYNTVADTLYVWLSDGANAATAVGLSIFDWRSLMEEIVLLVNNSGTWSWRRLAHHRMNHDGIFSMIPRGNVDPTGKYILFKSNWDATLKNPSGSLRSEVFMVVVPDGFVSSSSDTTSPSQPTGLTATPISNSQINLSWTASTDNVGVTGYNIYRGGTQIATITSGITYSDTGLSPSTTYSYTVTAYDAAGNVSVQSTSVSATTSTSSDTTPPTVSMSAPASGTTVSGIITVSANASDNIGVVGVQFKLDNNNLGSEDTASPYSVSWDTTSASNGSHTLLAVARDTSNNRATSTAVTVMIGNDIASPVISGILVSNTTTSTVTITWITDELSTSQVDYGFTTSYGVSTAINSNLVLNHSVNLANLSSGATYQFRVKSKDASNNEALSINRSFITTSPTLPDVTPPAQITNLAASNVRSNSLDLTWTAVGDDGAVGQAFSYEIRYLTSNITESNWSTAALLLSLPTPKVSGSSELYSVLSLSANTKYYFAIKAKDVAGNQSILSNVASTTTATVSTAPSTTNTSGGDGGSGISDFKILQISNLKVGEGKSQVSFYWTNPTDSMYARTIIVRSTISPPIKITDGKTIFDGNDIQYTDINLINAQAYYYALFVIDRFINISTPINVVAVPSVSIESISEKKIEIPILEQPKIESETFEAPNIRYYKKGIKTPEIKLIQNLLIKAGLLNISTSTEYFGPLTEKAIIAFQKKYDLPSTGIIGPITLNKMFEVYQLSLEPFIEKIKTTEVQANVAMTFKANLYLGLKNNNVKSLQEFLISQDFLKERLNTGFFGPLTQKAVIDFQAKHRLPTTGFFGPLTRAKIAELTKATTAPVVLPTATTTVATTTSVSTVTTTTPSVTEKAPTIRERIEMLRKRLKFIR